MATAVQMVEVGTPEEMESAISSYVVQGYVIANKTATAATMTKKKEFSVLWAVIGLIVCVIPLLIYIIIYAAESDKVVEIRLRGAVDDDSFDELARLAELRDRDVITEEEFAEQKRRLLGGSDTGEIQDEDST